MAEGIGGKLYCSKTKCQFARVADLGGLPAV